MGVLAYELLVRSTHSQSTDRQTVPVSYVKHNAPDFTGLKARGPDSHHHAIAGQDSVGPSGKSAATFCKRWLKRWSSVRRRKRSGTRQFSDRGALYGTGKRVLRAGDRAGPVPARNGGRVVAWWSQRNWQVATSMEVRAMALIRGFCVARGEMAPHGQSPLLLWKTPLRMLCLGISLSDEELSALECLILMCPHCKGI